MMKEEKITIEKANERQISDNEVPENSTELQRQIKALKKKGKYRFSFWDRRKLAKHPEKSYLITMYFLNGTLKTFVIKTDSATFKYRKKLYYLYYEESWFDLSMNQYHLYYFENMSVPVNREYIKQGSEAFYSVKPDNLEPLIKFEYVKVLAGAHSFDKMLKIIMLLSFVSAIGMVIMVISLFLKAKPG